jgi:hypothetical protein
LPADDVGVPLTVREPDSAASELGNGVRAWASADVLTITTFGSTSCPNVPSIAAIEPELARVDVEITTWVGELCTTDIRARTFEFEIEEDLEGYTLEVSYLTPR